MPRATVEVHQGLIDLARRARRAATVGDEDDLEQIAVAMLTELAVHLDDERLAMMMFEAADAGLDAPQQAQLRSATKQLLDLAAGLQIGRRSVIPRLLDLADAPTTSDGRCNCLALADEIVASPRDAVGAEEGGAPARQGVRTRLGRAVRRHRRSEG